MILPPPAFPLASVGDLERYATKYEQIIFAKYRQKFCMIPWGDKHWSKYRLEIFMPRRQDTDIFISLNPVFRSANLIVLSPHFY
jgi:hypothetical protein